MLIADDDDDSRIMLAFILEEEGWQVQEASNGKETIEKLIEVQPDLLILDNRMPEFTGVEVYQHLKSQGFDMPIVFTTAYGSLQELACKLDITYFVSKPYDIPKLMQTIESAYQASLR
ncbi:MULTISPECIES: response regulator [unclassified Anabaena]|uniref:response regulator n=1 Tax=unclassified Anabaena TaxID=2619674 RepID=UPI0030DBD486